MAVSTPGHPFGESEPEVLAVITVLIGLDGNGENPVSFHHFIVTVALHAHLTVELLMLRRSRITQRLDSVKPVAISARRGILVAGHDSFPMARLQEIGRFPVMALFAGLDNFAFVVFQACYGVN
jgi:membrane protein YdbS with pleckstrin-like domain